MRRLLATLALAALAATPAGAVEIPIGTAGPDCSPAATATLSYDCQNLMIPVNADGALIDATLYLPKSATAQAPVASMLMTHGYGGWHRSVGDIAHATLYANAGYAVLSYTSRGFGRSQGQVRLQSPEGEVRDAMDLITWLGTPSNTGGRVLLDGPGDPRVGMSGGSYAGGIQLLTAAQDPAKRLDVIAPQITWNDLRYSLSPNGVIHHAWIDLLYASGKFSGHFGPIGAPTVVSTEGVPADQDVQILTSYATNDSFDMPVPYSDGTNNSYEYLARRSVGPIAAKVTTPMFLIQGQRDTLFTLNEATRTLAAVSTPAADKKLMVFSAGHGAADLAGERALINARLLSWMDKYLRGNALADTGPAIEVWRPWVSGANFAAPGTPGTTTQTWSPASPYLLANLPAPTSHSEVTNFQGQTGSPALDALPGMTAADLYSIPVTADAYPADSYIVGSPEVRFHLSTLAPEAVVFAKLYDRDPAGNRTLIHRQTGAVRMRGDADYCSQTYSAPIEPLAAGGFDGDACLNLPGVVWKVPAGHTLVLTLATSDTMFFNSRFPGVYNVSNVTLTLPTSSAF